MADPDIRRLEELMGETDIWEAPDPNDPDPSGWGVGVDGDRLEPLPGHLVDSSDMASSSPLTHDSEPLAPPPGQRVLYGEWTRGVMCPPDPLATFCPWRLVRDYADLYVGKGKASLVKEYFDLEYLLENQTWDFFYLYNNVDQSRKPFLLVPTAQVLQYLEKVNNLLGIKLTIPAGREGYKFHISFEAADGYMCTIRPRYLGQAPLGDLPIVEAFNALIRVMPDRDLDDNAYQLAGLEHRLFQDLWRLMKETVRGPPTKKNRGAKKKTDKNFMRAAMHKGWGHATKRVQRYMGLRQKVSETGEYTLTLNQQPQIPELNLDVPVPFSPEDSVVFICVDCEAYEMEPSVVTEVGLALLDTKDLKSRPPGVDGKNWFELIQARHLRVKEQAHRVNSKYIEGCPDDFDFGKSEFVPLSEMRTVLKEIFAQTPALDSSEKRPVVLIGHDVQNDIDYLARVGFWVEDLDNVTEIIDNQGLQQFMRRQTNGQKLERILGDLGIPFSHLHNAGNDAVYTLQSLIVLAVRQRHASLKRSLDRSLQPEADLDIVREHDEGWSSGGEGCDGGPAPPPPRPDPARVRNTVVVKPASLKSDDESDGDGAGMITATPSNSTEELEGDSALLTQMTPDSAWANLDDSWATP